MWLLAVPEPGQLVKVRNKYFLVQDLSAHSSPDEKLSHRVTLESVNDNDMGSTIDVIWELESNTSIHNVLEIPAPEKWDSLDRFMAFIYAIRWSAFSAIEENTFLAPFHAAIDIEDYQLEPLSRALKMPRVNLLLADDVGLGKTIETGLIIQELLARKRIQRILVLCPASLQIKWKEEMESKFQLRFNIIDKTAIQNLRKEYGIHVNPWNTFPRLITSFDFLKREQQKNLFMQSLQNKNVGSTPPPVKDWDLLVVDEAHNIAPSGVKNYIKDSDRTKLLMGIIEHFDNRIFLTATPHNGYTESFTALLELLDPLRFSRGPELSKKQLKIIMIRRLKEEIEDALGRKKFAVRNVKSLTIDLNNDESLLHNLLNKYIKSRLSTAKGRNRLPIQFTLTLLKKRFLSSPYAFYKSLETHYNTIQSKQKQADEILAKKFYTRANEDWDNDEEKDHYEENTIQEGSKFFILNKFEQNLLDEMKKLSEKRKIVSDSKVKTLLEWIDNNMRNSVRWNNERLVIFTEYKDTIEYLKQIFDKKGISKQVMILTGGMLEKHREEIKKAFQADPSLNPVRILLATDAISEGIDLQNHCKNLIHWEIPWNPNRMEQRNGRIDRHGQGSPNVNIWHFIFNNNEDSKFLQIAIDKVDQMRKDLGSVGDVIASEIEEKMLDISENRKLNLDPLSEHLDKIKDDINYQKIDAERISKLRNALENSKQELEIIPENLSLLLHEGLEFNDGKLVKVDLNDLKGYNIEKMPHSWKDLDPLIRDFQGGLRTIVFDSRFGIHRSDTVFLHLNHPVFKRVINEFRKNLWSTFSDDHQLYRTSYEIISNSALKTPVIVVFVRILAVSKNNQKIHESVQTIGGEINKEQIIWLDQDHISLLLKLPYKHKNIPRTIGDFFRKNFIHYEQEIKDKVIELETSETIRIRSITVDFIKRETKLVESLIKDRIKEIKLRLEKLTNPKNLQSKLTDFTDEEKLQFEEDAKWLKKRIDALRKQLVSEPKKIKNKFELSGNVRIFPLGVLYLLPENLLEEK